jgi:hypothetical protein
MARFTRFCVLSVAILAATLGSARLAAQPVLEGRIEGARTYVSPTGIFKVQIPVLPELGGDITDTRNVVTFQDDFNVHVSIAAFPQDATQRWELSTRGLKDYLVYFFSNFVLADFRESFEGVQIESAKFIPATMEGSLLTYILIPGGTMFPERAPSPAAVAKRGNLLFVRNGHIVVVSTELAEKVIAGKLHTKTVAEEDDILRTRLLEIVSKMEFAKPPVPPEAPKEAPKEPAKK